MLRGTRSTLHQTRHRFWCNKFWGSWENWYEKIDFVGTASRLRHFSNRFQCRFACQGVGFRDILTGSIWCRKTLRVTGAKLSRGENACHFAWQGQDSVQILCVASAVFPDSPLQIPHSTLDTLHWTLHTFYTLDSTIHFLFALTPHPIPHSSLQGGGMVTGENSPPLFELCFSQKYPKCSPWLHSGSWLAFSFHESRQFSNIPDHHGGCVHGTHLGTLLILWPFNFGARWRGIIRGDLWY